MKRRRSRGKLVGMRMERRIHTRKSNRRKCYMVKSSIYAIMRARLKKVIEESLSHSSHNEILTTR